MKIETQHFSGDQWKVVVHDATRTEHTVRVTADDLNRFGGKSISIEKLLEESFRFLLERESNTSILSAFDLPVISRYFPEYEREIRQRIAGRQ